MLKKIECIVRVEKLEETLEALRKSGVPGATVSRVQGFGKERLVADPYLKEKAKIEIYLEEAELECILDALTEINKSGKIGDGKIAILNVEQLIRIRTKETRTEALY